MVECATNSNHIYGARKNFFLKSSLARYKEAAEICRVSLSSANMDRVEKVIAVMQQGGKS